MMKTSTIRIKGNAGRYAVTDSEVAIVTKFGREVHPLRWPGDAASIFYSREFMHTSLRLRQEARSARSALGHA